MGFIQLFPGVSGHKLSNRDVLSFRREAITISQQAYKKVGSPPFFMAYYSEEGGILKLKPSKTNDLGTFKTQSIGKNNRSPALNIRPFGNLGIKPCRVEKGEIICEGVFPNKEETQATGASAPTSQGSESK